MIILFKDENGLIKISEEQLLNLLGEEYSKGFKKGQEVALQTSSDQNQNNIESIKANISPIHLNGIATRSTINDNGEVESKSTKICEDAATYNDVFRKLQKVIRELQL